MKNILKRGLFSFLVLVMLVGLMPVTAFAAVGANGEPDGINYTLVLSIYTGEGFPGEPAVYDGNAYVNINSSFKTQSGATFARNGNNQLNWPAIQADMNQGATNYNTMVWGVYDTTGLDKYFVNNATINDEEKESTIIQSVKGCSAEEAKDYEIVWYVIKFQHSRGSGWFGRTTNEWHIDGVIKEREKYSINYYGNGNTSGEAPLGTTTHPSDEDYKVLGLEDNNGKEPLKKVKNGVEVSFLGWSARADGSDTELAFYQPGDTISATDLKEKYNGKLSLYAMWDTTTKHTATVNTYLDNVLADEEDIHDAKRELYLSPDKQHYYPLTRSGEGVYTTQITGNGKFLLYYKEADGNYVQVGNRQLTIYNQNGSMDVNHYSVTYDCDGGSFAADPGKQIYYYGDTVTAITEQPTKKDYRFLGWKLSGDEPIQPGEEVTDSITAPITLVAQWEKTVNVTVNVTINHRGGDGFDQVPTKDDVFLALVSRENEASPYLEVPGKTLELGKDVPVPAQQLETKYLDNTFKDMPGGSVQYTVVTSKSGYDTDITATQDDNGDWTINVVMDYRPTNFDLKFTVEADDLLAIEAATGKDYLPDAAIVKVTFWATGKQAWEVITQQAGGSPGVRVDLDPKTGKGSGNYPVWMYESNTVDPYMYRVRVTAFVYPDGSIVAVSDPNENASWTDQVYTATVEEEKINGLAVGKANGDLSDALVGKLDESLDGAYYSVAKAQTKGTDAQQGTLNIKITMPLYDVTFNANGGAFGSESETARTAEYQYKIPSFKDYVPTRKGGYTFAGWYLEEECTTAAAEGADLSGNITLYAKWIEPLTIQGKVNILGTYVLNEETVEVNEIDKAKEAIVVLMENRNGSFYEVDSQKVDFTYRADGNGDGKYSFTEIPNTGKEYRIQLLLLNYDTEYDNEGDDPEKQYIAVFGDDNEANVDAELTFVPPSYNQDMIVDATAISEDFRPENVLAKVIYRDTGDSHPYQVISQHRDSDDLGVIITLTAGEGEGSESIWKWHTDGTLYEYQMYITEVDGEPYDVSAAPYYIVYEEPAYWNSNTNSYSNELKATLIPNEYPVVFVPNADGDEVTNMVNCTSHVIYDENDNPHTVYVYDKAHKWSDETNIAAEDVPQPKRVGYTFTGWTTTVSGVNIAEDDGAIEILGEVQTQVILQANWKKNNYTVTTAVEPTAGGTTTGGGTYEYGSSVTVVATPAEGYTFEGWYEGEKEVSKDLSYTIENITADRELVAQFSLKQCVVTTSAKPAEGGTTSGGGTFGHGTRVNVEAEAKTGYVFTGWYEGETQVCETAEYSFDVTGDRTLEARFAKRTYEVTVTAQNGGSVTGGDTYEHGTSATVVATPAEGYTFEGWYEGETQVSDKLEYTFEVTSNRELTAKFKKDGLLIEANPNNPDHGTTSGSGYYDEGNTATVTATPKEGYKFLGWYVADEKVSAEASYSFTVTENCTLTAKFAAAYTVTTVADPDGAGKLEGAGLYTSEETVTLRATNYDGYYFVGWYDEEDKLLSPNAEYTLEFRIKNNRTFTAKFEKKVTYKSDYVYLFGYDNKTIGAEGTLLRGEVAQMIYRLVRQNGTPKTGGTVFKDTEGKWFQSGMAYMAEVRAIDGTKEYGRPYGAVSCGETYKMICLGLRFTTDATLDYSDYAAILNNSGYPANRSVTSKILRYEFCEIFNKILGRTDYKLVDADDIEINADTYGYEDLSSDDYYYRTMMLATSAFTNRKVDLEKRIDRNEFDYGN